MKRFADVLDASFASVLYLHLDMTLNLQPLQTSGFAGLISREDGHIATNVMDNYRLPIAKARIAEDVQQDVQR